MSNDSSEKLELFQNPKNESLEKVELVVYDNGVPKVIPALSKHWVVKRYYLLYEIPNIYDENGKEILGAKSTWLEIINFMINDFSWLLRLPFFKFWSNISYNRPIMTSIISILQNIPRFHNLDKFPNDIEMQECLEKLRRKVLNIFARIVTSKESPSEFMTPDFHGTLIYEKFLITIPILMDLCQLFGRENEKVVNKIIKMSVKSNYSYIDDLKMTVECTCQLLTSLENKLFDKPIPKAPDVIRITEIDSSDAKLTIEEVEDMVIYLMDVASNIDIFLTVYPQAIDYYACDYFIMKIISVYENIIPIIYRKYDELSHNSSYVTNDIEFKRYLLIARAGFIKVFRSIIFNNIANLLEHQNILEEDNIKKRVDEFLNYLTSVISDRHFIIDYNLMFSIEDDIEMLHQITSDIDEVKENFIKRSISEVILKSQPKVKKNSIEPMPGPSTDEAVPGPSATATNLTDKSDVNIKNYIRDVKDVMCDLGDGFIEKCLKHYKYNTADVINAILEDNLPSELKELDRTLPYIPADPAEASAAVDRTLGFERLNVFDGDEFDVMTQDKIDKSRVHRGKRKDKYKNLNEMLNDKSFKTDTVNIYSKYGVIEDEYDDEYDDTYESHDVGLRGADDCVEMDGKPFTTPRVLRNYEKPEVSEEESEEEEDQQTNGRCNFVQDPSMLREKREAAFRGRVFKRGGKSSGSGDVVGKPKGQGNDKDVLINRDKKNTNKSSRANHNRRSGAEWKRRQGMVPS
ncbi:activating signal cointegrator 1 complex subunit 2 [Microplitis demolitor]|uniref:activating signal cointegrator 1 complex subunit 2 n=1 Tax=Microplitis demolitor TaxID=69319 RepID=UPI0004CD0AE4|nr:activating signal cointegrator 1 complex subunit 2 [Microplitis demolitor]